MHIASLEFVYGVTMKSSLSFDSNQSRFMYVCKIHFFLNYKDAASVSLILWDAWMLFIVF